MLQWAHLHISLTDTSKKEKQLIGWRNRIFSRSVDCGGWQIVACSVCKYWAIKLGPLWTNSSWSLSRGRRQPFHLQFSPVTRPMARVQRLAGVRGSCLCGSDRSCDLIDPSDDRTVGWRLHVKVKPVISWSDGMLASCGSWNSDYRLRHWPISLSSSFITPFVPTFT